MMAKVGRLIDFHRSALDHRLNEENTAVRDGGKNNRTAPHRIYGINP